MSPRILPFLALPLALLILSGCVREAEAPEPDEPVAAEVVEADTLNLPDALAGTQWRLVDLQSMDDAVEQPGDSARYTMSLGADGTVAMLLPNADTPAVPVQAGRDLKYPEGDLYFVDTDAGRVRAIDLTTGVIRTVAGTGELGLDDEEGLLATETRLRRPFGLSFDPDGNLYIMDSLNNRIVKVAR